MSKHQIHIGTSGWHYKHWRGTFYPEGTKASEQFPYYQKFFSTVELNNPFYRLPSKETFTTWKESVAPDFTFAVKASRYITHMKYLKDPEETLHDFMENVVYLGEKLGVILFQLPPGWKVNIERLQQFLDKLPPSFRYVFEFRNETWYSTEVFDLLRRHNCAFCIYELAGHITPFEVTADFIYLRLHGPGNKYQGSYSDYDLRQWAATCKSWATTKEVYVYFDNDDQGFAAFNAIRLQELVT